MPTDNLSHLQAVFAENTADGYLVLLTLTASSLSEPIRIVNDNVSTLVVGADTYIGYRFGIRFPDVNERGINSIPIVIGNVNPSIGQTIEQVNEAIEADVKVVRLEDPTETLYQYNNFYLRNVRVNLTEIRGDLEYRSGFEFQYPRSLFNSEQFPGLGRGF